MHTQRLSLSESGTVNRRSAKESERRRVRFAEPVDACLLLQLFRYYIDILLAYIVYLRYLVLDYGRC